MLTELYYFTGTGNGLFIAKKIREQLSNHNDNVSLIAINSLNLSDTINTKADVVGIIYPTYAMASPKIVKTFASKLKVNEDAYLFIYAHCGGGGVSGAIMEVADLLAKRKVSVSNTYTTTFPSNSTLFKYSEDKLEMVLCEANRSVEENANHIRLGVVNKWKESTVVKKTLFKVNNVFSKALEGYMKFDEIEADDKCIRCGLCSKLCPVENIEMLDKPSFSTKCEMCLSCVNNCPKQALAFKKMNKETFKPYRHPDIMISDLTYR